MSALITVLVALAVLWIVFLRLKLRLSMPHLCLFFLSIHAVGVFSNGTIREEYYPTVLMLAGLFAFVFGLYVYERSRKKDSGPEETAEFVSPYPGHDLATLALFSVFIFVMVGVHYYKGGIPLFSQNIEVDRFEAASSGLMGIPSRINLFGTLFLLFLYTACRQMVRNVHPRLILLERICYAATAVALLLSGFRSSLIVLFEVFLISQAYLPARVRKVEFNFRKAAVFFVAAMSAVFILTSIYATNRSSQVDVAEEVYTRITHTSGTPFYYIVTDYVPRYGIGYGTGMVWDVRYMAGLMGLGSNVAYSQIQLLAADMRGRNVWRDFNAPMTINFFGQTYVEFGVPGLVLSGFLFGVFCGWIYHATFRSKTVLQRAIFMYMQLAIFSAATKGNVVYDFGNRVFLLLVVLAALSVISALANVPLAHIRNRPGVPFSGLLRAPAR